MTTNFRAAIGLVLDGELVAFEAHRRYWLDRFTLDEIREMAEALWPDDLPDLTRT